MYATLERLHNVMMNERNSIEDAFETKIKIMHYLDISAHLDMKLPGIKSSLLCLRGEHNAGR